MEYREPKFNSNGSINCEINHPQYGWIPFTADLNDTGAHFDVVELFGRMVDSGTVAPYIPPTQEELDAQAATTVRNTRDFILQTQVDPFITNPLRWADLTSEKQAEWAAYRRALLDITAQPGFPHDVTWPTQP